MTVVRVMLAVITIWAVIRHVIFGNQSAALPGADDAAADDDDALHSALPGVQAPADSITGRSRSVLSPWSRFERNQMRRHLTQRALVRHQAPIRGLYDAVIQGGAALARLLDVIRQHHDLEHRPSDEWIGIVADAAVRFWYDADNDEPVRPGGSLDLNVSAEYNGERIVEQVREGSRRLAAAIDALFTLVTKSGLQLDPECGSELCRTQIRIDMVECRLHEHPIISDVMAVQIFDQIGVDTALLNSFPVLQIRP